MKKIIYLLAFFHLTIISLTIFHALDKLPAKSPVIEKSLAFVCSLNYSVWRYGFFAPDVGRSNEVEIKIYDANGHEQRYSTLDGFNFYLANIDLAKRFYGFKVYSAADTLLQDLFARSVATRMINLHPGTCKVTYTLRGIRYPTLDDFHKKMPVQKTEIYSTDFILSHH